MSTALRAEGIEKQYREHKYKARIDAVIKSHLEEDTKSNLSICLRQFAAGQNALLTDDFLFLFDSILKCIPHVNLLQGIIDNYEKEARVCLDKTSAFSPKKSAEKVASMNLSELVASVSLKYLNDKMVDAAKRALWISWCQAFVMNMMEEFQ